MIRFREGADITIPTQPGRAIGAHRRPLVVDPNAKELRSSVTRAYPFSMRGAFLAVLIGLSGDGALAASRDASPPQSAKSKPPEQLTTPQLAERSRDSVVMISTRGRDGTLEGVGTGFFISTNGLVATSLHVIGEGRPISLRMADGSTRAILGIHAWDAHADLAILRAAITNSIPLRLASGQEIPQGTPVVAIGHPLGLADSVVEGVVSARREMEGVEMLQLAIPVEPGNSGGPVVDRTGQVQGIVNAKSALTRNLGFATSVSLLQALIKRPNPTSLDRWLHLAAINASEWRELFGAAWHARGSMIQVDGAGEGFGGRALLLSKTPVPNPPFDIVTEIKLDDESGAAGLVFDSDGGDRHYGFYPTHGRIRLTAFGGPDVNSWRIIDTIPFEAYRPGEWNALRVRVESDGFRCFVNEELALSAKERVFGQGSVGLAKFRDTTASFRGFHVTQADTGKSVGESNLMSSAFALSALSVEAARADVNVSSDILLQKARDLERTASQLRRLADEKRHAIVAGELKKELSKPDGQIDLIHASLLLAKFDDPKLDIADYERRFNDLSGDISGKLAASATTAASEKVKALTSFLFEENGFHGSRFDYYNLANCHLNSVMDEREGIPVTLAVVFLDLGWRSGLHELTGLPLPGHFLVKFAPKDRDPELIDVFDGGRRMTFADADELARGYEGAPVQSALMPPATRREMILRILSNLRQFTERDHGQKVALPYADLQVALAVNDRDEALSRLDRARAEWQVGDRKAARNDLQWILDRRPPGVDLDTVGEALRTLAGDE
jgi:regulator of sirC expression with transglutaminase-like and TPR domain